MKCKGLVKYVDSEEDLMLTYTTDTGCSDWAFLDSVPDLWTDWMGHYPDYFIGDYGGVPHEGTFLLPEEYLL